MSIQRLLLISLLFFSTMMVSYANIGIEPLRIELTAAPGERLTGEYVITNTVGRPMMITVKQRKYFTLPANKKIKNSWFKLETKKFKLDPDDSKTVSYTITVPKKAVGFLCLLNSFKQEKIDTDGSVKQEMLNTAFSVPVYVRIKGREDL
ncbi:MAG: hypothetical protein GF384_08965, partial [Elusimicrobia bacterium]|nr:hypothetical protein [Elusimicrobiota bacterium]